MSQHKTSNVDFMMLWDMINSAIVEIQYSASANIAKVRQPDKVRWKTILRGIASYFLHIDQDEIIDIPENNPDEYELPEPPKLLLIQNICAKKVCFLLSVLRTEVFMSDSAREPDRVDEDHKTRAFKILRKIDRHIDSYVPVMNKLDLPESTPGVGRQGHGQNLYAPKGKTSSSGGGDSETIEDVFAE